MMMKGIYSEVILFLWKDGKCCMGRQNVFVYLGK